MLPPPRVIQASGTCPVVPGTTRLAELGATKPNASRSDPSRGLGKRLRCNLGSPKKQAERLGGTVHGDETVGDPCRDIAAPAPPVCAVTGAQRRTIGASIVACARPAVLSRVHMGGRSTTPRCCIIFSGVPVAPTDGREAVVDAESLLSEDGLPVALFDAEAATACRTATRLGVADAERLSGSLLGRPRLRWNDHRAGHCNSLPEVGLGDDQWIETRKSPIGNVSAAALLKVARRMSIRCALHGVVHLGARRQFTSVARRSPLIPVRVQDVVMLGHHMVGVQAPPAEYLPAQWTQVVRVHTKLPCVRAQVATLSLTERHASDWETSGTGNRDTKAWDQSNVRAR